MVDEHVILVFLQGCRDFRQLKQLLALMTTTSLISRTIPCSRLVDSLVDVGALDHAHSIFHRSRQPPSLYIWNSMIRGLSGGPSPESALHLYATLQRAGLSPDHFTFPFVLKACSAVAGLDQKLAGKPIHAHVVKTGFEADVYVSASLIRMYAASGDVPAATSVFDSAPNRNVVSWTTAIAAHVEDGRLGEALRLFDAMELAGERPNEVTWVQVLAACGRAGDLETWRRVCGQFPRGTAALNVVVGTALLDMYVRCGCLREAREVFDGMRERNLVSWNAMIGAYNQCGGYCEAMRLYKRMSASGMKPDKVTLLALLGACSEEGALTLGESLHGYIEKTRGSAEDLALGTSLVDMYAKSGEAGSGLRVFNGMASRDAAAWTTMIIGLALNGHSEKAVGLFREMEEGSTELMDSIAFIGVLSVCSHAGMVEEGRRLFHSMISKYGFEPEVEHYGCMIDMLGRAGYREEAENLAAGMAPLSLRGAVWSLVLLRWCGWNDAACVARLGNKVVAELDGRCSGSAYVLVSNAYAGVGAWDATEWTRHLMWKKGVKKAVGISSLIPLQR